jgi:hypothetical protein
MVDRITFKFVGMSDVDKALAQLTQSTAKNVLRRVGRQALVPFDKAWRERAPVDLEPDETGKHLKDSGGIGSKLSKSQRQAHERASSVEVFAGPGPHPKAVQQEFGNENHAPQPFLRPAWAEAGEQIVEGVAAGLRPELDKVIKNLERKAARAAAKNRA